MLHVVLLVALTYVFCIANQLLRMRLPVPNLELPDLMQSYKPLDPPDCIDADYCPQVIFEIAISKVAATLFPQDLLFFVCSVS